MRYFVCTPLYPEIHTLPGRSRLKMGWRPLVGGILLHQKLPLNTDEHARESIQSAAVRLLAESFVPTRAVFPRMFLVFVARLLTDNRYLSWRNYGHVPNWPQRYGCGSVLDRSRSAPLFHFVTCLSLVGTLRSISSADVPVSLLVLFAKR